MSSKFTSKRFFITCLYAFIFFYLVTFISIYRYAAVDETKKCDAAIVLGTAVWKDQPSPVFEERIKHGIWLYKNNYVHQLIFTGGIGKDKAYAESAVAKAYAIKQGVPDSVIFTEDKSTLTQENLFYASAIVKQQHIHSVLIVSDPIHMKRAMRMTEDYPLNAYASPTRTSRYISFGSKLEFLLKESIYLISYRIKRLFG